MQALIDRMRAIIEELDRVFEHSKLRPAWSTVSTFFFSLKTVTPLSGTHIRDNTDLKRYMSVVMAAVAPTVLFSIYLFGWRSLVLVVLSYAFGISIELGFAIHKNEEVTEGMFVTCILYPMILPPTVPFWMAGVGLAVGIILGKEIFGGTGKNIFNPAIVGRTFLAVTFPTHMASRWHEPFTGWPGGFAQWSHAVDTITGATPLISFKNGAPDHLIDMFLGVTAGSLGETSALIIIVSGMLLVMTRIANWRLPLGTILGAMALAALMHHLAPERFAPALYHLFGGGLLFGAFFMTTDPVTCPFSKAGKWVYAILIGLITIMIRNLSGFPEGIMFAILFMNMFAPVLDDIVLGLQYGRRSSS